MTLSVVFPGQGSQSPGMLAEIAQNYPVVEKTFEQASQMLDYDLWDVAQNADADKMQQTEITQVLMFVGGLSLWRVWEERNGHMPVIMAGHSLGEYTALTAAGALGFEKALPLVALRGKLMANAVEPGVGGMAALIGMSDEDAKELCLELSTDDGIVEAVNFNSPGQVVISGHLTALESACTQARDRGARKAMMLPVSVPNHSSLMEPAKAELAEAIEKARLQMPKIPVMQNVDATIAADTELLKQSLQNHVVSAVNWTLTVKKMAELGVTAQVELGPGKVLAGLCRRIDKTVKSYATENIALLDKAVSEVNQTMAEEAEAEPC